MTRTGIALQRAELVPQRRHRLVEFDAVERRGQRRIVVGDRAAVLVAVGQPGEVVPVGVAPAGELAAMQPPLDVGGVGPVVGGRRAADIALDPRQAARLDHRADVVQHQRRQRVAGRATPISMPMMPPREVPTTTARGMPSAAMPSKTSFISVSGL